MLVICHWSYGIVFVLERLVSLTTTKTYILHLQGVYLSLGREKHRRRVMREEPPDPCLRLVISSWRILLWD